MNQMIFDELTGGCACLQVHGAQQGIRWTSAKGKRVIVPVVPPAALDIIVRLTFQSKSVLSAKNNARLHRQYERLQDLAIEGAI